jgi:glycosyltransferase involved in cell wall biosynthesis
MKCGVGAYTKRLAEALAIIPEVTVSVLTDLQACDHTECTNVEVMPIVRDWRMRDIFLALSAIRRWKPDIVHIQYPTQGYLNNILPLYLPLLAGLSGKKCVQTWHEAKIRKYDFLLALCLDTLISVRKELKKTLTWQTNLLIARTPFIWIPSASLLPTANLTKIQRSEIRQEFVSNDETLLVFYGFMAPLKGVETLFEVMVNMPNAKLVMVFDLCRDNSYHQSLLKKIEQMNIGTRISIIGYLPDTKLAEIMAAADAVVLPFRDGGGDWNTSIDSAVSQGVFVLTTSLERRGYDSSMNTFFVAPGEVNEMVSALQHYAGTHIQCETADEKWGEIAKRHVTIYRDLIRN